MKRDKKLIYRRETARRATGCLSTTMHNAKPKRR